MEAFFAEFGGLLLKGLGETVYMSFFATLFSYLVGFPMGVLLFVTKKGGMREHLVFHKTFGWGINMLRSVPFIILIVTVMPFTRLIAGKAIGATAAIVPLVLGCCPFVARMVESALEEVDSGVLEACSCMGATPLQLVIRVLTGEALPSLIRGCSITTITLIGYSAIAGAVGAGGLGDIAIRYGYHRGISSVMWVTIVMLVILVSLVQGFFTFTANHMDKRISH